VNINQCTHRGSGDNHHYSFIPPNTEGGACLSHVIRRDEVYMHYFEPELKSQFCNGIQAYTVTWDDGVTYRHLAFRHYSQFRSLCGHIKKCEHLHLTNAGSHTCVHTAMPLKS
jgi:hypothetical protein